MPSADAKNPDVTMWPRLFYHAVVLHIDLKALLHYAICLGILLRHKLHAKLQGVSIASQSTSLAIFLL
jgi:hypothetical protein